MDREFPKDYAGWVFVFSFVRRTQHLRHRWSAMAVCEFEHSWHVFPYTLPILLVPHNYQSPVWCLDTEGAAGRGMEICLPYSRRHQDRELGDVPIKHPDRKAFQSDLTLNVWCLPCGTLSHNACEDWVCLRVS